MRIELETLADNHGVAAVLHELSAICYVWAGRADENNNETTSILYNNAAASIRTLAKHIANEIATENNPPPEAV